ncbi:MAG: S-methyl-5-thioribose-1-phosphate isomerase [Gammaproteobacteria bacterium]
MKTVTDSDGIRAIRWAQGRLELLDQRKLPCVSEHLSLGTAAEVAQAIRDMVVRGAPAIGITAAYGVALAVRTRCAAGGDWQAGVRAEIELLSAARPTAVNLRWAMDQMTAFLEDVRDEPGDVFLDAAARIHTEDIAANHRMGEFGAALVEGEAVLTHCNTGSLATGGYGTALGVVRSAYRAGRIKQVYADETRPWLQGSRLTAWELVQDNIPVTLICEGASAALLRTGRCRWVIVGADRVAGNGDVANKIGTYNLAVNCRHHGVKFMVVAPTSTVDMATPSGAQIPIENRAPDELLALGERPLAPAGATAWNPVFDITPAELIDALVTEHGVVEKPDSAKLRELMRKT